MIRIEYHPENGRSPWVIRIGTMWWAWPTLFKAICRVPRALRLEWAMRRGPPKRAHG